MEAIDPVGLVRQYVKRDANGERLEENDWFQEVVTWPMEPAYDSYTVIRQYAVEPPPTVHGSPARIPVRYEVLGWVIPGAERAGFLPDPRVELVEFVVVRDDQGWRIEEPQMEQHVLASVVASDRWVSSEDAALIRDLAAATPPPEP
jgi:hypothetical protein